MLVPSPNLFLKFEQRLKLKVCNHSWQKIWKKNSNLEWTLTRIFSTTTVIFIALHCAQVTMFCIKYIKERGLTASDVTVRPWPPVKKFWW